jgi:hypothetical protein
MDQLPLKHTLPDKCPLCGEVVRNDMSVVTDPKTRSRTSGHVQFACNYEIEIVPAAGEAPERTMIIHECRKGKIWPQR